MKKITTLLEQGSFFSFSPAGFLFQKRVLWYMDMTVHTCIMPYKKEFTMENAILDILKKSESPMRPGDIAKELGADAKEVSKAINTLKKEGKIHSPKRCFYAAV